MENQTPRIATREEVESLKRSWAYDPCFDLSDFNDQSESDYSPYKDELIAYEKETKAKWQAEYERQHTCEWETICTLSEVSYNAITRRMKIFGGWLVKDSTARGLVFVPDPKHEWEVVGLEAGKGDNNA
jgi:hypothetical protein